MAVQIQLRRDTAANWTSANPTLALGEMGFETDTLRYKLGDGITAWTGLGYGVFDGFSSGRRYIFDNGTGDSDPGAGQLRFNHGTFGSITHLYLDNADASGGTATAWLDSLDDSSDPTNKGTLFIQCADDLDTYREFVVTGAVVDGTGYRKVPVTPLTQNGTVNDGDVLVVAFFRTGAAGSISGAGTKSTPVDADKVVILDSADADAVKTLSWANLKAGVWAALGALINGGTAKTTPADADLIAIADSAASYAAKKVTFANLKSSVLGGVVLNNYLAGLTLSNNGTDANNDIDIAAGVAMDTSNTYMMLLASALTKRIDASWAVGSGNGGLDGTESVAGTPDLSTWYHVWLIRRPDTGVVDALFSESATSPTMPTNYTQKRRLGAVYNDASGNILAFTQYGNRFIWAAPAQVESTTVSATAQLMTLLVPTGVVVEAFVNCWATQASSTTLTYISDPASTDLAPSSTVAPGYTLINVAGGSDKTMKTLITNTSGQVRARANQSSTTVRLNVFSWNDFL